MWCKIVKGFAVALSCLPLACGGGGGDGSVISSGGFSDPGDPEEVGAIVGSALTAEGLPAADVLAMLLVGDGGIHARVRTDAAGAFRFDGVSPGRYRLVLNDGVGGGSFETMVIFAGGVNDIGAVLLQPLEGIPGILDLHGIGFEERLTRLAGDYRWPAWASDRSAVYVARKLGGDANYQVLRVSVPDGTETVLGADEYLDTNTWEPLQLHEDRAVVYQATRPDPEDPEGMRIWVLVVRDALDGRELATLPLASLAYNGVFAAAGGLYALERADVRTVGDGPFGPDYQWTHRVLRIDLGTGEVTRGAVLPGWASQFAVYAHDETRLAVVPVRWCVNPYDQPGMCDGFETTSFPLHVVELATLATTSLGSLEAFAPGTYAIQAILAGGGLLAVGTDGAGTTGSLRRTDLATGVTTVVATQDCSTEPCLVAWSEGPELSADETRLLVHTHRAIQNGDGSWSAEHGISEVELASGRVTALPMQVDVDGTQVELCRGDYAYCEARYLPGGAVRISDVDYAATPRFAMLVDVDGGAVRTARSFPIGEEDGHPGWLVSPDGAFELLRLRDLETGFHQLHAGPLGAAPGGFAQRTFLTSNHHDAVFAPDGTALYYFTRDPVSGYEQLFRVATLSPGEG